MPSSSHSPAMTEFQFFQFRPSPALAPFVELIWGARGPGELTREAVLPNGAAELMINFGPRQKVLAYGDRSVNEDFARAWLAGIQDQPLVIGSPEGCDHLGVRFRPGGAHAFFDLSMESVTNQVVELDLLIGRTAEGLRDRLGEARTDEARARAVEAWLLERRWGVHPYHAMVRRAIDLARYSQFHLGVGDLCEHLGLSNRHLITQFRRIVGTTPKTILRIERFHTVVHSVREQAVADWTHLAYRFGFADQSHLVREFHRFAGVTPSAFLARRTPDGSHLIVD
ncbi:MAG TPA: helix-turn-helix domain-containing protein [Longimicrobiaceae bacterium]|nr:helix-turn-helix domain-containing protein [Longimicrobiaceae bacterium]